MKESQRKYQWKLTWGRSSTAASIDALLDVGNSHRLHQIIGRYNCMTKQKAAAVSPTLRDLAWAAGFLEGEGTFLKAGRTHTVAVHQVNIEPLERLQQLFGGSISLLRKKLKNPKHNDIYYWQTFGARARGVMMTLYSLLSQKRKAQIRKALGVK